MLFRSSGREDVGGDEGHAVVRALAVRDEPQRAGRVSRHGCHAPRAVAACLGRLEQSVESKAAALDRAQASIEANQEDADASIEAKRAKARLRAAGEEV